LTRSSGNLVKFDGSATTTVNDGKRRPRIVRRPSADRRPRVVFGIRANVEAQRRGCGGGGARSMSVRGTANGDVTNETNVSVIAAIFPSPLKGDSSLYLDYKALPARARARARPANGIVKGCAARVIVPNSLLLSLTPHRSGQISLNSDGFAPASRTSITDATACRIDRAISFVRFESCAR